MSIRLYKINIGYRLAENKRPMVRARCVLKIFRLVSHHVSVTGGVRTVSGYWHGVPKTYDRHYNDIKEVLSDN